MFAACFLLALSPPLPPALAPHFGPPARFAGDFGAYRSPLVFDDGTPVRDAAGWEKRRREIRVHWMRELGPWPPPVESPAVEVLETAREDGYARHKLRVQVAPDRTSENAYLLVPDGTGPFPAVVVVFYDAGTGVGLGTRGPDRDFARQLVRRGFVALSFGSDPNTYYPDRASARLQPLSFHAHVAANLHTVLARRPDVDAARIGIVGHSYGGKWAMFASCLSDKFAAAAWSDGGVVFDETRPNVNYWEPWYLGHEPGRDRNRGVVTADNPRTGPYKRLVEAGRDLHELHALMAPRPFLVSGGSEDPPERWRALNHAVAVNTLLGHAGRVGMTNRPGHGPTPESNAQIAAFFEHFLKPGAGR